MEQLRNYDRLERKFLLLLTDGRPNLSPKGGEDKELKNYFIKFPKFNCQINTFGFGYGIDSKLLLKLAWIGKGI